MIRTEARYVAVGVLGGFHFDLLRFGTRVPRLPAVAGPSEAMLLVWKCTARMDYVVQAVTTTDSIPLRDVLVGTGWSVTDVSVLMFVRYLNDDDNNRDGDDHNGDPAMPDAPMCDPAVDDHHHDDDVSMTAAGSVSAPPSTIDHDESNIEMPQLEKSTTTYDSDFPPEPEWNDDADLSQAIAASLKQQGDDDQHDPAASSSNHGPVLPLAADEPSGTDEDTTLSTEPYDDELTHCCTLYADEINDAIDQWHQCHDEPVRGLHKFDACGDVKQALTGEVFRVDVDTDNLSGSDMVEHEAAVMAADRKCRASLIMKSGT